jgi:hypothetical protein
LAEGSNQCKENYLKINYLDDKLPGEDKRGRDRGAF